MAEHVDEHTKELERQNAELERQNAAVREEAARQEADVLARKQATLRATEAARAGEEQQLARQKKCRNFGTIAAAVVVTIVTAITVSVVVTTKSEDSNITPMVSPKSPEEQLAVACHFIDVPDVTECLAKTLSLGIRKDPVVNTIPTEIGLLTQLTYLQLGNSDLVGTIPSTLGNLVQLKRLDLFYNPQLTGPIPATLENLTKLTYLVLYENTQLHGTIPSALCANSGIEIVIDCPNVECTCCLDGATYQDNTFPPCPSA